MFMLLAVILLLTLLGGLLRIARGPTAIDRMLSAQLFGTGGVALLLLLGVAFANPYLLDVALVTALLSAFAGLAFVRLGEVEE